MFANRLADRPIWRESNSPQESLMLFDEGSGAATRQYRYGESFFQWFNTTSRPPGRRSRILLNGWLAEYPESSRAQLVGRFRKGQKRLFYDALFELYMYILLKRMGFEVEVDVPLVGGSKPDFRVSRDGTPLCYVEVTVNHGIRELNEQQERIDELLDRVGPLLQLPSVAIHIHQVIAGPATASASRVARAFREWVQQPQASAAASLSEDDVDEFDIPWGASMVEEPKSGWKFLCSPSQSKDAVVLNDPFFRSMDAQVIPSGMLRDEVRGKLQQHKTADLPVVVAVSFADFLTQQDELDTTECLLGDLRWRVSRSNPAVQQQYFDDNGLWTEPGRSAAERCPAVIMCKECGPGGLDGLEPVLWRNPFCEVTPFAKHWAGPQRYWKWPDHRIQRVDGTKAAGLMGFSLRDS